MNRSLELRINSFQIKPLSKKFVKNNISRLFEIEKDYPENWTENDFLEYEKDKWSLSKYAKINQEIVGFLVASNRRESFYLNRLMIHRDYRNKGLGKEMFHNFYLECKKRKKHDNISLRVLRDNIKAIPFYENLGFKIISFNQESGLYFLEKKIDLK